MNNPYGQPQMPQNPQALIDMIKQNYTPQYNQYMQQMQQQAPPQQNTNGKSMSGAYFSVSNYSEVEQSSTPIDGTASLFFDFSNGTFWSKKFVNGRHEIQAYYFKPIVSVESQVNCDSDKQDDKTTDSLNRRITRIEKALFKPEQLSMEEINDKL